MHSDLRLGNSNKEFGIITTQKKLIIYFFVAVAVLSFIFNYIFYKMYSANIEQIVTKECMNSVTKTTRFADMIIQDLEYTSNIVQGNTSLQKNLLPKNSSEMQISEQTMATILQDTTNNSASNISSIDLYLNEKEKLITTDYGILSGLDQGIKDYYYELEKNDSQFSLQKDYRKRLTVMTYRNYEQITFTRPFYDINSGAKVGLLAINIDKFVFKNLIRRDSSSSSIIMDDKNNVLISTFSNSQKGLPQRLEGMKPLFKEKSGHLFFDLNGRKQILVYNTSDYSDWRFITVIPVDTSMSQMNQLRDMILILFILMSVMSAAILILLLSENIYRKVNKLIASMREVEKGNFDITIKHDDRDEFGFMYTSFNNMTGKIKSLFGELYQQKLLQKDAELKLLQSKINPHFIYNIFDSMNWLIQLERYEELESLVDAVSNYFKKSLNVGKDFISISDMVSQLMSYVEIQKIRFKDRFTCTFDFQPEISDIQILNFILQPLVENSICHGIEPKVEKCNIVVKGWQSGENILLSVEDDGMGIPQEKLDQINYFMENEQAQTDDYFAITNINKRIKLFYGNEYGLTITSRSSEGTLVTVRIPAAIPAKLEETTC